MTARAPAAVRPPALSPSEVSWILDRLPGGVVVVDPKLVVCYSNLAAQRIAHPTRVGVGDPLPDLGTEPPLREIARRLFDHGVMGELELPTPDQHTLLVDGIVRSETRRGVLRVDDITSRARRMRSEHDFVVNAAHEFLSPLTTIAGAAHVLKEAGGEADVRSRFVRHIVDATERLISISTALLGLARAEAGVEPPRLELVPVGPLLGDVTGERTEVRVECPGSAAVLADGDLLRQALANLLANARRHSRGDVEVVVEDDDDGTIAIDIVDRGSGILPEHLERVTQRFFTGAGRDAGGFGIGLSIAARAIHVLGGTLELRSGREGTRARVRLPSARLL